MIRSPSSWEAAVLERLLSRKYPGVEELRRQLRGAQVEPLPAHGDHCRSIRILPMVSDPAPVVNWVPVRAVGLDSDGVPVLIFLHTQAGAVTELEVLKADSSRIRALPTPESLELIVAGRPT
jgi:hypothetical protein